MSDKERATQRCYVAYCACGCGHIVMAAVDNPEFRKDTAKEVGKCIKAGLLIGSMQVSEVRKLPFGCAKKGKT